MTAVTAHVDREQIQAEQRQEVDDLDRELREQSTHTESAAAPLEMAAVAVVQDEVLRAVRMTSWGEARDKVEAAIGDHSRMDPLVHECTQAGADLERCVIGPQDAQTQVILAGDSVGRAWTAALLPNLDELDWRVEIRLRPGCSFTSMVREFSDDTARRVCVEFNERVLEEIRTEEPDLVVMSNSVAPVRDEDGTTVTAQMWQAAVQEYLTVIEDSSDGLVLSAPPADQDMRTCYTRGGVPLDCLGEITDRHAWSTESEQRAVEVAGAVYVDTAPLFCALGRCPAVVDGVPVKIDRTHITVEYAEHIAPALGELLTGALESKTSGALD